MSKASGKNRTSKAGYKNVQKNNNEDQYKSVLDMMIGEINVKPKTLNQKNFLKIINSNEVIVCTGPAGTGKTFLAASEALKLLKKNESPFKKIVLVKSVTQLKGEDLGFLKGDVDTKMAPIMYSFMANFHKIIGNKMSDQLVEQGFVEVLPLSFIRGMSLDNSIIIVDEAQNISMDNMKTILTRIGYNSKMIIIGDTKQVDISNKKDSSLQFLTDKFKEVNGFGVMSFEKSDQVRNPIINAIEEIFEQEG